MPITKCFACKKEYYERPSHIKDKNFCCRNCYSEYLKTRVPNKKIICLQCKKIFSYPISQFKFHNRKFCSRKCYNDYNSEHKLGNRRFYKGDKCRLCGKEITYKNRSKLCRSCGRKGKTYNKGIKHSLSFCKNISQRMTGSQNSQWKGDDVQYRALHEWVKKYKERPKFCELCGKKPPYDLANKGIYNRDFDNWWYLCRKCHMKMDGRIENLKRYSKS